MVLGSNILRRVRIWASIYIYIYRVSLWCMALSMPSWYKASEQAQGATSFCPTRRSTSPGSAQDQRHQEDLPGPRFTLRLGSKELVKVGLSQYLEIFHLIRSRLRIYKRKETFLRVLRSPDLSGGLRRKRTCRWLRTEKTPSGSKWWFRLTSAS